MSWLETLTTYRDYCIAFLKEQGASEEVAAQVVEKCIAEEREKVARQRETLLQEIEALMQAAILTRIAKQRTEGE